jgi:hypothetical protein
LEGELIATDVFIRAAPRGDGGVLIQYFGIPSFRRHEYWDGHEDHRVRWLWEINALQMARRGRLAGTANDLVSAICEFYLSLRNLWRDELDAWISKPERG